MNHFPDNWSKLNVVLCHDWLTGMRGGERVLEILCRGFPNAPVYTLIHDPAAISDVINAHEINTSRLQQVPGITKYYRYCLPLFPAAIGGMKTPEADLLISTSHCIAKGLRVRPGTKHVCYCFTPMRYAWTFYDEYFGKNPVKSVAAGAVLPALRAWDRKASARVDRFIAISRHIQKRIKDFYDRESDIVYPPVDTERLTPVAERAGDFDLVVSALVPYKRVDLAVRAYCRSGRQLKIVGAGTEFNKLRAMAGPNVDFLGWASDEQILSLYRNCRLLVFPGEEDFGIVPVEAQSCGTPVVAYGKGGALETVQENVSGVFFRTQTEEALLDAIGECVAVQWDPTAIRANAEKFSVANFVRGMAESIQSTCSGQGPIPS